MLIGFASILRVVISSIYGAAREHFVFDWEGKNAA
jgi:hypothetical protein